MKKEIAMEVLSLLATQSKDLNASLIRVRDTCTEEEFDAYRTEVGKILGAMYLDIIKPIHMKYPDLEPEALRQSRLK
ncbi:hypothetical protein GTP91_02915 [Rugamonas sp. FT82W]|uniref:Uncharacterized protein n=1 Tax=Duganella vulcania TaxID=2692166 RepID=A0A845FZS2_9BURK|nr:hypothetical protein [Duganella vulcania]MCU6500419.1 hypothetical protein [Rugamonas sp. A1-17]MYM86126.1 hypothetical protein [Duganella vulcania]